ncbi:MAG: AAA family ATPase [Tissierellia bacterium]|nr:AAA family ATPase [Tissierellia bacterium]
MLKELSLRNYLLLEDLHLEFPPGFSVITGETGSGKSVLLEGLRIVLGQAVSKEELRDPNKKAYFELIYEDEEEILALSREIFPSGRTVSRINGELVNLSRVREVFGPKIDFYGQRDDSLLLHRTNQQRLIFEYSKEKSLPLLEVIKSQKEIDEGLLKQLSELRDLSSLEREALEAQFRELENLSLDLEEDGRLEESFDEIIHSKDILENLERSKLILDDESISSLYKVSDLIKSTLHFSKQEELSKRLDSLSYELLDIREELVDSLDAIDIDEALVLEKERRFSQLQDVKKRFQRDLEGLVDYKVELEGILDRDRRQDEIRRELEAKRKDNLAAYYKTSKELLKVVEASFKVMASDLEEVLASLELSQARFGLRIEERDMGSINLEGHYKYEILASMNRGELRPMARILSGGEMSRLMLALKSIADTRELLVFDEIDSGISGRVAHEVARQIKRLSKKSQILAISHLPQVVAFADQHYYLDKEGDSTKAKLLTYDEHVEKLANMMSAQINEASLETARKMIKRAKGEDL